MNRLYNILSELTDRATTPIKIVHSTASPTGTIAGNSGAGASVPVTAPDGYTILGHIYAWNTGVIGMLCQLDNFTTTTPVSVFQVNPTNDTKNRGTCHVLTLCVKSDLA